MMWRRKRTVTTPDAGDARTDLLLDRLETVVERLEALASERERMPVQAEKDRR